MNIFGLDADIYGNTLEIFFHERIRPEKAFKDKEELTEQLKKDKEQCYRLSHHINFTK